MSKAVKGFLSGLAVIALVLIPACKHTTKQVPTTTTQAPAVTSTPDVPVMVTTPERVTTTQDFVATDTQPKVQTESLPSDIEELNRVAQQRGYLQDAFFNYDEAGLSGEAQAALTSSANWLKKNAGYNLLVEGHCDERGTEQYNLALGDRRANTVKDYLSTLGVDASRIRTVSYGEERPFDPGHDESAWAKNRRAHLVLVGK
jgi:peptidoglycan-associated lipoprotein